MRNGLKWSCPYKRNTCNCLACISGDTEIPDFEDELDRDLWAVNKKLKTTVSDLLNMNEKLFLHLQLEGMNISEEEHALVHTLIEKNMQKLTALNQVKTLVSKQEEYEKSGISFSERFNAILEEKR